jgi:hypothetical protein
MELVMDLELVLETRRVVASVSARWTVKGLLWG